MSESLKTQLGTFINVLLALLFSIPTVAAAFPVGTLAKLQAEVGPVLGGISALITAALVLWSLKPLSKASKVALAGEMPQVSRLVTTGDLATNPKIMKLADAAHSPEYRTVVTYKEALQSAPPQPRAS